MNTTIEHDQNRDGEGETVTRIPKLMMLNLMIQNMINRAFAVLEVAAARMKASIDALMSEKEKKGEKRPWHLIFFSFVLGTVLG